MGSSLAPCLVRRWRGRWAITPSRPGCQPGPRPSPAPAPSAKTPPKDPPHTPPRDPVFGPTRLFDLPALTAEAGAPLEAEDIAAILGEAEKFSREVLAPGSREADKHRAVYENGVVRLPPGYYPAYQAWVEGGWQGVSA